MEYGRPYRNFQEQVDLLVSRGLDCSDCDAAGALSRLGYYRLSGYTYPFRIPLMPNQQPETPLQFRAPEFQPGYRLTHALDLYNFDHSLRMLCLEALKIVEIGLRVRIAYVLGKRDRFGYLNRASLDEVACKMPAPDNQGDTFDYWLRKFEALKRQAKSEDFVRHYDLKYDGQLPVWVAVEVLDFGSVIRLFSLLERGDQNSIARSLGVREGRRLHKWLLSLGTLRNLCAHHGRLWNKNLTYGIGPFSPAIVDPELHHAARPQHPKKLYTPLAFLAYLTVRIDPSSNWPRTAMTRVRKFPDIPRLTPQGDMGFPEGWDQEALWNYVPVHQRNGGAQPGVKFSSRL